MQDNTLKIAGQVVTMRDMFDRPDWVEMLKYAEDTIKLIDDKICEYYRTNREGPKYLIVSHMAWSYINSNKVLCEKYMIHCSQRADKGPTTFRGLIVVLVADSHECILEVK